MWILRRALDRIHAVARRWMRRAATRYHAAVRLLILALSVGGCAKLVEGGCASDADCEPGVSCDLESSRCVPPPCHRAAPGDDDPECGTIDCDGLDNACQDFEDATSGRCLSDGACKPANDPMTCTEPVDLCAPYACDTAGPAPACRSSCDEDTECSSGATCLLGRCCRTGWEIHTVDSDGDVGQWGRIAVDADGNAHGVWLDLTRGVVRIGENAAAAPDAWTVSSIAGSLAVEESASTLTLAVGAGGTPHVVHRLAPEGNVVYSYHDGSDWVSLGSAQSHEAALTASEVGMVHVLSVSAALLKIEYDYALVEGPRGGCEPAWYGLRLAATTDASGRVHAAWWDIFSLHYAYQMPTCDPASPTDPTCCDFLQLTVLEAEDADLDAMVRYGVAYDDREAEALVTYMAPGSVGLRLATCTAEACSSEPIDVKAGAGRFSSVAIGAGGVHVVYHDKNHADLRYATNARGSWEHVAVDEDGDVGAFASLAYGPDGRLHALYYDADGKDVRYATLSPDCVPGE